MKIQVLLIVFLLSTPVYMLAQYGGGNGRGEINSVAGANQLNGIVLNIYGGGNGRGETDSIVAASQLNGTVLNIYGGGNGRGETDSMVAASQLNGTVLNIYGGGNGRGETDSTIASSQLNGTILNIYGGGNGRGETDSTIASSQLNGTILNIYGGGNGRGEIVNSVSTLQLDGLVQTSMFLGGAGRGETVQQTSNVALPVKLISFSAVLAGDEIKVQWQTASEQNSAFFIVQKSTDGVSWQPIGQVAAAGHSDISLSYQLMDAHPAEGANYYRLKPTDIDGQFTYSAVAIVYYHHGLTSKITVYPNPVKYQFTVAISGVSLSTRLKIALVSAQGQTIFEKQNLSGDKQTFDISALAGGTYYLVVDNNGQLSTAKIVKE